MERPGPRDRERRTWSRQRGGATGRHGGESSAGSQQESVLRGGREVAQVADLKNLEPKGILEVAQHNCFPVCSTSASWCRCTLNTTGLAAEEPLGTSAVCGSLSGQRLRSISQT